MGVSIIGAVALLLAEDTSCYEPNSVYLTGHMNLLALGLRVALASVDYPGNAPFGCQL